MCQIKTGFIHWFSLIKVLEAQMKADLADKESLEARRAQQEEESRENCKLISEQKAVRQQNLMSSQAFAVNFILRLTQSHI